MVTSPSPLYLLRKSCFVIPTYIVVMVLYTEDGFVYHCVSIGARHRYFGMVCEF